MEEGGNSFSAFCSTAFWAILFVAGFAGREAEVFLAAEVSNAPVFDGVGAGLLFELDAVGFEFVLASTGFLCDGVAAGALLEILPLAFVCSGACSCTDLRCEGEAADRLEEDPEGLLSSLVLLILSVVRLFDLDRAIRCAFTI